MKAAALAAAAPTRRLVAAAVGVFVVSCVPLMVGVTADGTLHRLRRYGNALVQHGQVPYRDYALEYPPGAIPIYALPSLVSPSHHATVFRYVAAAGWILVILLLARLVDRAWPLFLVALVPLALGPFSLMRFDQWPVVCVLGALVAQLRGRTTLAYSLLAVGTLVKVWPLLLVPLFWLYARSRRALLAFAAIVLAGLLPFALIAPQGAYKAFAWQTTSRHLHVESLGGSILLALQRPLEVFFDAGSWSLRGSGADLVAKGSSALELLGLVLVAWLFWRSRRTAQDLLTAVAASVAVITVLPMVLSPQFMLWLAPFVAFAPAAAAPYVVACLATQLFYPRLFDELLLREDGPIAVLVARNAVLLVVLALMLRAMWVRADRRLPLHARRVAAVGDG